jgi:uncharacterized protein YfaS (alpha-2-macroglobulin family)
VNGAPQTGQLQRVLKAADLASPLEVKNIGDQPVGASIVISGAGIEPEPAAASGFQIERSIYTPAGKPATVEKVAQNERFVIVLKVTEDEARLGCAGADRLPGDSRLRTRSCCRARI